MISRCVEIILENVMRINQPRVAYKKIELFVWEISCAAIHHTEAIGPAHEDIIIELDGEIAH